MRRVVFICMATCLALGLPGCEFSRENRPSVLLVAVEGLGFESLSCDGEDESSYEGLRALCSETVRFSHAFAPSTMSQATLASLLTGLYPLDHGVRHNGSDFLSAKNKTLAEGALAKGYRTLFVSGGPPVWRKSGLAQGFEIFDDNFDFAPGVYYRPAGEVFRAAINWITSEGDGHPVFGVMYLADLQFPDVPTRSEDGEARERTIEGQRQEILESLDQLVRWLKSSRRWNSTNLIITGLNAQNAGSDEPAALSLHTSSLQVSLFIKPARKERDNVIEWGVDRNVSLVDVGYTLFQILGVEAPAPSVPELSPQSLVSALHQPEPDWDESHLVLSESAWPDWLEGAGVRLAVRQTQFLYIHDQRPLIFNTLTDSMENYPLKSSDPLWNSMNAGVVGLLQKLQSPPFKGLQPHWPEMLTIGRAIWTPDGDAPVKARGEEPWARWQLAQALHARDWKEVKRLSQETGDPVGTYVAARHLGERLPLPRNPCLRLFLASKGDKKQFQSECEDERMLALHAWMAAASEDERAITQDRFQRLHLQAWMDQDIGRLNYLNGLRWDVDRDLPAAPRTVDFILTLKEFEPFAKRASAFLHGKDVRL